MKSPFLIFQHVVPLATCKRLAKQLRVEPNKDEDGFPEPMARTHPDAERELFELISPCLPKVSQHFELTYKGTESFVFHQLPTTNGKIAEQPHCDNAVYKRKKWIRTSDRDITGVVWLKDYQEHPPFDLEQHVYGGKLEFPVYNFGFQPQAGTVVFFPSCERFIHLTSSIQVGELQLAKFYIHGEGIWLYDPLKFPGDFRTWFTEII